MKGFNTGDGYMGLVDGKYILFKGGAAMKGIFESMFNLNHNGNISPLESAMEFTFLNELLKDDSEVQTELELSGLDPDELEFMDADERREALEDAGLDPDEYDF